MHSRDLSHWTHSHVFDEGNPAAERGAKAVLVITATMMVVEIAAGWVFNSMALLADGWHMSSHAVALGLSAVAYVAARRFAHDARFAFGTWKIEVLGGFTSAVLLLGVAALMATESIVRLLQPEPIRFTEAIAVAFLGLGTNVVCAVIIGRAGSHSHAHGSHGHAAHGAHHHHDLNLRSAYLHVIADALTSVLAIVALTGGKYAGWYWLDPAMGVVGAALIVVWAVGLARDSSRVLLDCEMDRPIVAEIKEAASRLSPGSKTSMTDLHVWRVGRERYACIISLVTDDPALTPADVRNALSEHEELVHVTVEINLCPEHGRATARSARA